LHRDQALEFCNNQTKIFSAGSRAYYEILPNQMLLIVPEPLSQYAAYAVPINGARQDPLRDN
jgi:hypothetical protein